MGGGGRERRERYIEKERDGKREENKDKLKERERH